MTYQQSTKCVTTLSIVITFQHIVITFLENSRPVRELVNRGQNVANALYISFNILENRYNDSIGCIDLSENSQSVANAL
jgi:hypothetical protein